jgi:iron(III) transport system substrate-binding protein
MSRLKWGRASLGIVAASLWAGIAFAADKELPQSVIDAARKEGSLVVYSGYVASPSHEAIAKAFQRRYGVTIEYLQARGSEIITRFQTEQNAGRYLADVYHAALANALLAKDGGNIQPHGGLPNADNIKASFKASADEYMAPIFTINYGFLINTNIVKPEDEPKSWLDLLDPKWKDKILADDFRASGGGVVAFQMTMYKFGREYHEKLVGQHLVFAREYRESARRVARGEFPIYMPYILSDFPNLKGLPVKYILPKEGSSYGSYSVSIFKNPPHPNAARLLANFYLSDEVQTIYAREAHGIMLDALSEPLPPDIAPLVMDIRPLTPENLREIPSMFDVAKAIYR